jgi:isoleucyl-tRNA synthetase
VKGWEEDFRIQISDFRKPEAGETKVVAQKSSNNKCQRCWNYWPSVGTNSQYPDVCERCAGVLRQLRA